MFSRLVMRGLRTSRDLLRVAPVGAFGEGGVERVLTLLRTELFAIMQQVGAPSIKHLTPAMVRRA